MLDAINASATSRTPENGPATTRMTSRKLTTRGSPRCVHRSPSRSRSRCIFPPLAVRRERVGVSVHAEKHRSASEHQPRRTLTLSPPGIPGEGDGSVDTLLERQRLVHPVVVLQDLL